MTTKQFRIHRPLKMKIWNNRMDDGKRQRIGVLKSVRIRLKFNAFLGGGHLRLCCWDKRCNFRYNRERKMFLPDILPILNRGRDIGNSGRIYYQVESSSTFRALGLDMTISMAARIFWTCVSVM